MAIAAALVAAGGLLGLAGIQDPGACRAATCTPRTARAASSSATPADAACAAQLPERARAASGSGLGRDGQRGRRDRPRRRRELGRRDVEVVAEGPGQEALGGHRAARPASSAAWGSRGRRGAGRAAASRTRGGAPRRTRRSAPAPARASGGPRRTARSSRPRGQAEVEARGGCPRPSSGRQCPALSPTKKTPSSTGVAHLVRDPVALVALAAAAPRSPARRTRRLLDVVARVERADADAQLVAGGEAPRVPRAHVGGVEPQLEVVAGGRRVDLEAARQPRLGGWIGRPAAEHAAPAERVDDERRASGRRGRCGRCGRVRPSTFAVSNCASHCVEQQPRTAAR